MESTPATVEELPPNMRWFAPWTWKRRWKIAIATPVLLLVAYVLSLGPALLYVERTGRGLMQVYWVYKPLRVLRRHVDYSYTKHIDWYAELWSPKIWEFLRLADDIRDTDI